MNNDKLTDIETDTAATVDEQASVAHAGNVMNKYSRILTQDITQTAAQAMYYAIGFSEDDFNKAQVGIASMGWDGNPCNMHLNDLSTQVRDSVNNVKGLFGAAFLYQLVSATALVWAQMECAFHW